MKFFSFLLGILLAANMCFAYASELSGAKMHSNKPMSTDELNALNMQCYNTRASDWDRLPFADFLPNEILLKHQPVAGMRALDIGSGTGMLAQWLSKHGFSVLCLDPSDEMVRRCRKKGLETVQTTLQEYQPKEKFGLIVAVLSLIHVPKREISQELKRIASWLNPGGTFVLTVIEGRGEGVGEQYSGTPRYFSYYTRQEVLDLTQSDFHCVFEKRTNPPIPYLIFIFQKK